MFVEVDPGHGKPVPDGGRITVANTLPDINPDEIYSALDADTRPYLKLLVAGAGKGLQNRGGDLREVLRRFEPIHRDLARVTSATASRRHELKHLIHDYGLLMDELGRHPQQVRRLVTASRSVFDELANEDTQISESVARLPGSLRASERPCCSRRSSPCGRRSGSSRPPTRRSRRSCARPSP
jgi:ABC-type transporter Mla subunit MlaD